MGELFNGNFCCGFFCRLLKVNFKNPVFDRSSCFFLRDGDREGYNPRHGTKPAFAEVVSLLLLLFSLSGNLNCPGVNQVKRDIFFKDPGSKIRSDDHFILVLDYINPGRDSVTGSIFAVDPDPAGNNAVGLPSLASRNNASRYFLMSSSSSKIDL